MTLATVAPRVVAAPMTHLPGALAVQQLFNPLFEPRGVVAQPVNRVIEFLDVAGGCDQRPLLGPVLGERTAGVLEGLLAPALQRPPGFRHAVGGEVAEDAGEVLLHVPAQVARETVDRR